jgi:hypothetical protein
VLTIADAVALRGICHRAQASRGPVGSAAPRSDGQSNAWPITAGKKVNGRDEPGHDDFKAWCRPRDCRSGDVLDLTVRPHDQTHRGTHQLNGVE